MISINDEFTVKHYCCSNSLDLAHKHIWALVAVESLSFGLLL